MPQLTRDELERLNNASGCEIPGTVSVSRTAILESGLTALQQLGAAHICAVCIPRGGSCCSGCQHLLPGVGCQKRNVSCTAWLCGFLKYMLYETGLLRQWNSYWDQVPGLDFRVDFTPDQVTISDSLHLPDLNELSEALSYDLEELSQLHSEVGYILELREKLDRYIDRWLDCDAVANPTTARYLQRSIKQLTASFHRFHYLRANRNYTPNSHS